MRIARQIIFAVLGTLCLLALLEIVQRIRHPYVGFRHMTNSMGFRSQEFEPRKPEGAIRILFVGGSTTFGVVGPVEETFPFMVGEILREKFPGQGIETINAARPGDSSYGVVERIQQTLWLEPDMLMVMTGDADATKIYTPLVDIEKRGDLRSEPWLMRLNIFVARHSVFYVTLREKISILLYGTPLYAFSQPADPEQERTQKKEEWLRHYPRHFRKNLEMMIDIAQREKIQVFLVKPPFSSRSLRDHPLYAQAYERLMEEMVEVTSSRGISLIPLEGIFEDARGEEWISGDGVHLGPEGNQRIARALSAFLMEDKALKFSGSP